nr:hypothetical protein [Cytophagales bacterium]
MNQIIKYIVLVTLMTGAVSCNDEYLERFPLDTPSSETFFANETELSMAVTGVYNRLWFWPAGIAWYLSFDFASDDGWDRNGSPLQALGRGEQNPDNGFTNSFWSHFYRAIGRVNFITTRGAQLEGQMDAATFNLRMSEARFFRALFYTYLSELYGDVPLITQTLTLEESQTPRTPKAEVVNFIISELDAILPHLPNNPAVKDRIGKGAVLAL